MTPKETGLCSFRILGQRHTEVLTRGGFLFEKVMALECQRGKKGCTAKGPEACPISMLNTPCTNGCDDRFGIS